MAFELGNFVLDPSEEKLDDCTKANLLAIATYYNVYIPSNARKLEIKSLLTESLIEQEVLQPSGGPFLEKPVGGGVGGSVGVEAAAGAANATNPDRAEAGAEAPVASTGTDPIALLQAGVATEDLKIILRMKEVDLEMKTREVELMHLRVQALEIEKAKPAAPHVPLTSTAHEKFDVSKHIALVPSFRESEVDSYFNAFERIATALAWPKNVWSLLLQCKLVGKAQEVCSALSIVESLDYDLVKATVLRAYELVPEAYRQRFRACKKSVNQTYVEFAREKSLLFDKWCTASKASDFMQLRELMLLEEFKSCLTERIVVYLNEQKVTTLKNAAVLAEEFVLTHRPVFSSQHSYSSSTDGVTKKLEQCSKYLSPASTLPLNERECYYCHEKGHLVATCPELAQKDQNKGPKKLTRRVNFVQSGGEHSSNVTIAERTDETDEGFCPFIFEGSVSLTEEKDSSVPITILRDTGANQSLLLSSVLPFSSKSSCGYDTFVWGLKMSVVRAPMHAVVLQSPLVAGPVVVALRDKLPTQGIHMILGNDLAGDKVFPSPEILDNPVDTSTDASVADGSSFVFPSCVVTRAQTRKMDDIPNLSDTFLCNDVVKAKLLNLQKNLRSL